MESQKWSIDKYVTIDGLCPFDKWFATLQPAIQVRVDVRLDRVNFGNFGDRQSWGEGIYELRLHFGSGYRILYLTLASRTNNKSKTTNPATIDVEPPLAKP